MKVRLKELGTIFTGNTPSKKVDEYWSNRDIKFIKPDVIKDELCVISSANEYISASAKNVSRIVPANSILVTCIGKIGRVGITEEEVSFNQQINAIVPNEAIIPKYLAYAIYANRKQLKAIANAPVVPIINKTQFSDFKISICESVEKQNKIVRTLDVISEIITHDKKKIEALDELIKARFVEMFKGKYDSFKVDEKLKTTSGGTPKSSVSEYYDGGDIPWLTSGEVNYGGITKPSNYITEKGLNNSSAKWVPENSIVIAMYGATAGKVGIVRYKTTTNQAVCSVLPNDNFNQEFLRYAFQDISEELTSKAIGGGQPNISQTIIKNSYIVDAPIEEQERFASFVKQVDKSKFAVQKSLEKTQLLFDSLMQEYFG